MRNSEGKAACHGLSTSMLVSAVTTHPACATALSGGVCGDARHQLSQPMPLCHAATIWCQPPSHILPVPLHTSTDVRSDTRRELAVHAVRRCRALLLAAPPHVRLHTMAACARRKQATKLLTGQIAYFARGHQSAITATGVRCMRSRTCSGNAVCPGPDPLSHHVISPMCAWHADRA